MKFGEGKWGAVNGMRPDGKIDYTSIQSEEVWIGLTDAVASLMLFEVTLESISRFFFAQKSLENLF